MSEIASFLVARDDLQKTRVAANPLAERQAGEVLLKVDRFAFTANNITYAETGVVLKYWEFYPAPTGFGIIPVWGFADVVESRHDEIKSGERIYGYWPMATHALLRPERVSAQSFIDATAHRRELPSTYNIYQRTAGDPNYDRDNEDLQSLFAPLFGTSFLIDDFLAEQKFFGARTVVMSSASSKTAFSLAYLLRRRAGAVETVGLTSPGNRAFVTGLGCYDRVLSYDELAQLPSAQPAVFVDFAGNGKVRTAVHEHFRDNLKQSTAVGMSHRDLHPPGKGLPGAKPVFFFAPERRRQRLQDWGRENYVARYGKEWSAFVPVAGRWLKVRRHSGRDAIERIYLDTLNGKVTPDCGNILSL